jgi:hypothetical protein
MRQQAPRRLRKERAATAPRRMEAIGAALLSLLALLELVVYRSYAFPPTRENEPSVRHPPSVSEHLTAVSQTPEHKTAPSVADQEEQLPTWISNYVAWHAAMRRQFPGRQLWEDPDAPKLLVRTCLGLCGGLHDRLGQLPWDLYLANQTGRVLLLHWHRPVPLEAFLVPPDGGLDWRVPREIPGFFPHARQTTVSRQDMRLVRDGVPDFFEDYAADHPEDAFWRRDFSLALERAQTGDFAAHKVLRHRLLGHLDEHVLEARLLALGETDPIHATATFGAIFRLFFQLAPDVQTELDTIQASLGLTPNSYAAVHCRVRHPKATVGMVKGKNQDYPADKTGLPWQGETRLTAIATATRALQCAHTLQGDHHEGEPIYFFSDSNDLVHYMAVELHDPVPPPEAHNSTVEQVAYDLAQSMTVLGRPATDENAHLDKQKGRPATAYYGTFLDLFLAIHARCVTYGVGNYAVFASKISHTSCKLLYQEEAWGGNERKKLHAPVCHLDTSG